MIAKTPASTEINAEELVSCDGCGELKLPIWNTGSLGVLDGRFCSRECLEAYVDSK